MTLVRARSGEQFAQVGDISLCYETFGEPTATPLLLVMGLSCQMVMWEEEFCDELVDRGFFVIRFDNRDIGRSTILKERGVPSLLQLALKDKKAGKYTIEEMAADAAGLLDHLEITAAHVVGVSMGGMISQALAIHHPEKVLSLTSIMSTTGNSKVGQPHPFLLPGMMKGRPAEREPYLAAFAATYKAIGSKQFPPGAQRLRKLGEQTFDRGLHRSGTARQMGAIVSAKDRTPELRTLNVTATVIHGTADRLVRPSGGKATADAIPGAKLVMVDGMAHDLAPELWPRIIDEIEATAKRAQGGQATTGGPAGPPQSAE